jgi:hypothetical protein
VKELGTAVTFSDRRSSALDIESTIEQNIALKTLVYGRQWFEGEDASHWICVRRKQRKKANVCADIQRHTRARGEAKEERDRLLLVSLPSAPVELI